MKYIKLLAIFLIPLVFISCNRDKNNPGYDYMGVYDMYYTKYYKAYSPNPVLHDSATNQMPVAGAIPRGKMPFGYPGSSIPERAVNQAKAGAELKNPVMSNKAILTRGKEQYTIFCSSCHGDKGDGNGHLYTSGLYPAKPTSLIEAYAKNKPDGEIYYVISKGSVSGLMGPHESMILPDDRWAIIHYVRTLQK
jgi:mono/diheme cytochrome c family protein